MTDKIPFMLCIDVEPDEFLPDPRDPKPWLGYERTHELLMDWRDGLSEATGEVCQFSWFVRLDGAVAKIYGSMDWPAVHYHKTLSEAADHGDLLGLHLHASRWSDRAERWVEDFLSQSWINEWVQGGVSTFERAFGQRCMAVRFGNHWMNQATSDLLETLGVAYDLTIEPGAIARSRLSPRHVVLGEIPDQRRSPRRPYRRSSHDHLVADPERVEGMWMVPVTTMMLDDSTPAEATAASDDGAYLRLGLWRGASEFRCVLDTYLAQVERPCVVAVMRSNQPLSPHHRENIEANLSCIASHPLRRRFRLKTPAQEFGT